MTWYRAGTITSSGNVITGVGTKWLDNKMGIGAGQILLVPGDGAVKMYEILAVDSDTKLRLVTIPSPALSGAYAIISIYTDSFPDFGRRLSANLGYYQSQMDGWQKIMTGTGNVTIIAPDGTSVVMPSFNQMNININSKLSLSGGTMTGGITSTAVSAITLRPFDATAYNWIHWTQTDGTQGWRMGRLENNGAFYLRDYSVGGTTALKLEQGDWILTSATAKNTPWINATLLNGWVPATATQERAVYRKILGLVFLEIGISGGVTTDGTQLFVLPVGYRPASRITIVPYSSINPSQTVMPRVSISSQGSVDIISIPNNAQGVHFSLVFAVE
ncbi:hypothetical protein CV016_03825 [Yersinia kristensenii]|uniref:hypothetical protein n=1 Tax=Yersinia kristensenii TaxID=28152 RepID=UPI000C2238FA|nr:hypothetical protein [Yersinia kristensenii]PJG64175.1 hypothetical protein CV016_03825 [Yersinia kristensenii]